MALAAGCSRLVGASSLLMLLGAAAPAPAPVDLRVQIADAGPLGAAAPASPAPAAAKTAEQSAGLQPAPVPNQDVDAPSAGGEPAGASLMPALFSQKAEFAGDGYANKSSQQEATDSRRAPAAGLNWSVPVK